MIRRRFGRTEIMMPIFSTGGMQYQDGWKDKPLAEIPDAIQTNLNNTILRSVELGMNHIETARGYGPSERQLGVILPTLPRDEIIVQTKIGPEEDPAEFLAYFDESLERLQLDHVDLLGIHGINNEETLQRAIRPGGCLAAARSLVQEGRVKHVGFSTHAPLDIILRAINHDADGGFDYVNLHWYYIFQRNWPAVLAANEQDMGVFIISPNDKGGKLYAPPTKLVNLTGPLHPMAFNDLFCLSHPEVHTLSCGASKPSDFDIHVESIPLLDCADSFVEPIISRLENAMYEANGVRHPEEFSPGLLDMEKTDGLNLEIMLWLRHLALGWDMTEYGKMRFNLLGNGGHWFPGGKPQETLDKTSADRLRAAVPDHPQADKLYELAVHATELLGGEEVKRQSESD
ncbi:aldo/keto reductase [Poriferisphaera sp. WC338]|uniref:aldo/keto reductase n=1 Tax=Poriferisphaera sp. WC338 TaxID=3425129 RepID=UPI003D815487